MQTFLRLCGFFLIVTIVACGQVPVAPTETPEPKPTQEIPFGIPPPQTTLAAEGKIVTTRPSGTAMQLFLTDFAHDATYQFTNNADLSAYHPVVSPDGTNIAYVLLSAWPDDASGVELRVVSIADASDTLIAGSADGGIMRPMWSPDGTKILFHWPLLTIDLYVADLAAGTVTQLTDTDSLETAYGWTADGSRILYTEIQIDTATVVLHTMDLTTGVVTTLSGAQDNDSYCPYWNHDARYVAYLRNDYRGEGVTSYAEMLDTDSSTVVTRLLGLEGESMTCPVWNRSGTAAVVIGQNRDQDDRIMLLTPGKAPDEIATFPVALTAEWVDDGSLLVTAQEGSAIRAAKILYLVRTDGSMDIFSLPGAFASVSPSGELVAFRASTTSRDLIVSTTAVWNQMIIADVFEFEWVP